MRLIGKKLMFTLLLYILFIPGNCWAADGQAAEVGLTDINGHWAQQSIEIIYALGLDQGFPDHTYRPDQAVNSLDAIHMVLDGAGYKTEIAKMKSPKTGIPGSVKVPNWQKYMDFAVQQKFIPEAMLKAFKYDQPINRMQLAAIIAKALYLNEGDAEVSFRDLNQIPADYLPAVKAVVKQGLISGYPDGSFQPLHQVTRAELAAILVKLYRQGWLQVDAKKKIEGWVAGVAAGKNGTEVEIKALNGTQKVVASANCRIYLNGQPFQLAQTVNYRVSGILDSKRKLAYLELQDRRNFSPVQRDTYGSYIRHTDGEPLILTVKDLLNEEVDYNVAWDAEITDEKSKSKSSKDLLKKLKVDQFIKLGLTYNDTVKEITILDVKNITGEVDKIDRALYLVEKKSGSSKKYIPDHFYGWDAGRLVDKEGEEISDIDEGDKVKIFYVGEPFYERVLEIQKLN